MFSTNKKTLVNKKQGEKIDCNCRECRKSTKHEIVTDVSISGSDGNGYEYIEWKNEYQIVKCLGCESISFRKASGSDQDIIQISDDKWDYQPLVEIFPNPINGRQPLNDVDYLPDKLKNIYEESLLALNNSQPVLCGIGVRAIIETICKDKSAEGSNLFEKINSLVNIGILTQDGANILHKIRTLGNNATHEVKPHTIKELGLSFDVIDHLILGVYILPIHANKTFKH